MRKTKTSSAVKYRYNSKTYVQYVFNVRKDSELYKKIQDLGVSSNLCKCQSRGYMLECQYAV
jgi:hypothetical protein